MRVGNAFVRKNLRIPKKQFNLVRYAEEFVEPFLPFSGPDESKILRQKRSPSDRPLVNDRWVCSDVGDTKYPDRNTPQLDLVFTPWRVSNLASSITEGQIPLSAGLRPWPRVFSYEIDEPIALKEICSPL
jgi:hypothetical protein